MKKLIVMVPDQLDKQLQREARRRKTNKARVVQAVLERAFARPNGKRKSVHEVIGYLAGSLKGPGDLSTNPKYMEGFGK